MPLRGPLAAVLSLVLVAGSVGLTAAPASAASVAGTITPGAVADGTDFGSTFTDEEGTTDIPGVTYESFFSGDGVTPTGNVLGWALTSGAPTTLVQLDPVAAFTVRTASGAPFALTSFAIQDAQWLKATYTATGYNDGAVVATSDFTVPEVAAPVTITLAPAFQRVDDVRITSTGHAQNPGMLWQEGFRDIVVADPVYPMTLSALSLSAGALVPAFSATQSSYTVSAPNSTSSTTVTPTTTDPLATVTVNGVSVPRGSASGSIALNVGTNTITTVVTAGDGSATRTYTTTVTRSAPPSTNANLSALSISAGTLAPTFASGTTSYTANVPFGTTSLTATPTVAAGTATVTVNGVAVTSGMASGSIALAVGANTITTIVTAQDSSTTKTYTTTVTRAAASGNNQLSALSLSSGTLSPAFASGTTGYTASVSNATTSLTVTPTVAVGTASVTVNGVATTSGNASGAIALAVGSNTITTTVTAQNGTPLNYTVTVTRAGSANADLSALSLSSGTLSPTFASGTTGYTASVSNATTSLTVTPTVAVGTASVTVNGVAVASGNASGAIGLNVGSNTITTIVTAQDGSTTKTYTVTVTRAPSSNNNLAALSLSSGTLSPVFNAATTGYTASIAAGVSSLTVTPTVAASTASVTVNGVAVSSGAASGAIAMNPGSNTVTVVVTAQSAATKTYTVTITRALPSANADLSALAPSGGTLSPAFAAGTLSYTALVGNATTALTVTPTVADATASVTVNGVATTSGNASSAIALAVGANTIQVVVTAQNGTTSRTYTVTVTRAGSSDNNLSALAVSNGALSPVFAPSTTGYTTSIPASTGSITVTPTVSEPNATVTVDGKAVVSGAASGPVAVVAGSNTVTVVVTAQNGSTRTYVITVAKAPASTNADLSALSVSGAALNPAFNLGTNSYTVRVGSSTTSLTVTPTVADATATVTVDGAATVSGSASDAITLPVGTTVITTVVTAQDGTTTNTYTVTVTRPPSSDSSLTSLALTDASISPAFDPSTTGYAASVASSVSSVTVTATSTPTSTLTINGGAATNVPLAIGANTITVRVTAQDGTSTDYVVTVSRAFVAPGFTDATLGSMQVGVAFADSVSAVGTPVIAYAVTSGALPAGVALDPATGAVTGTPTAAGAYDVTISATSPYAAGIARITGTVLPAPVVPVVPVSPVVPVAPTPAIEIAPGFTAGTPLTQATLSVSGANLAPGSAYTIVLYSDPVVLARGVIDATGTLAFSTKLPGQVEAGAHRLVLTVVAPDGSVVSDTVWFTVLAAGAIGAVSFVEAVPYVEPAAAGSRVLASTGADEWLISTSAMLAALLIAAGIALVVVRRRRSREIG